MIRQLLTGPPARQHKATRGYQWIDCGTGQAVNNATGQNLYALQNGSYACIIFKGNCTDTTNCVSVTKHWYC